MCLLYFLIMKMLKMFRMFLFNLKSTGIDRIREHDHSYSNYLRTCIFRPNIVIKCLAISDCAGPFEKLRNLPFYGKLPLDPETLDFKSHDVFMCRRTISVLKLGCVGGGVPGKRLHILSEKKENFLSRLILNWCQVFFKLFRELEC